MMMDNHILISRLRVTGELGCDYKFGTGVNILKGSNSTGKTTLLWFIDFVFGSSKKGEDFVDPVRENCECVYVDLVINNVKYTIERSLRQPENIFVYSGIYDNLSELESKRAEVYGRIESKEKDTITSFYFKHLGILPGKVPISDAKVAKYSWRNLMSLIYVQQDKWNGIQAQNNFQPEMKKAVFEILMGIEDKNINLQEEEKRNAIKSLEISKTQYDAAKQILDKIDRRLGSQSNIEELRQQITGLEKEKNELFRSIELRKDSRHLQDDRQTIEKELIDVNDKQNGLKQRLEELEMLDSENELNIEKNRLLLNAKKIFSEMPITKCPKCFNILVDKGDGKCFICGQDYKDKDTERGYAQNLFLLMDERKELAKLIKSLKDDLSIIENKKHGLANDLSSTEQEIAQLNREIIGPIIQASESINLKLNELNKSLGEAENICTLLDQEKNIAESIEYNASRINAIQAEIDELEKNRVTATEVKTRFLEIMSRILVEELNLDEKLVGFDELYTPIFENGKILFRAGREDINKSKGAKVILGYYTAVLEYSLKFGSCHPKLLLLDTPRQEELDMSIFSKILSYWNALSHYNKDFQIIITGSEFPPHSERIIAEFHNRQASGDSSRPDKFSVYPIKL